MAVLHGGQTGQQERQHLLVRLADNLGRRSIQGEVAGQGSHALGEEGGQHRLALPQAGQGLCRPGPGKLLLASQADAANELITSVHRFTIQPGATGLDWDGLVRIDAAGAAPPCDPQQYCEGYRSQVTAVQENPADGTVYVVGYTAPRFSDEESLHEGVNTIFTLPTLAAIPPGTEWSPAPAGNLAAVPITGSDLALPISAVVVPPESAGPADLNIDGRIDAADLAIFAACATGPGIPYNPAALPEPPPGCTLTPDAQDRIAADFDRDGDVDQADFAVVQRSRTDGP